MSARVYLCMRACERCYKTFVDASPDKTNQSHRVVSRRRVGRDGGRLSRSLARCTGERSVAGTCFRDSEMVPARSRISCQVSTGETELGCPPWPFLRQERLGLRSFSKYFLNEYKTCADISSLAWRGTNRLPERSLPAILSLPPLTDVFADFVLCFIFPFKRGF